MPTFDDILQHYKRQLELPWQPDVPPAGRVWIVRYDKSLERRIRGQLHDLEIATLNGGHGWRHVDVAPLFASWFASHEFFDALVEQPEEIRSQLPEFEDHLARTLKEALGGCGDSDVLALTGCGSLFGLARVSKLVAAVSSSIRGRLMITFPGRHAGGIYRLLDACDGWNYHAIPIPNMDAF